MTASSAAKRASAGPPSLGFNIVAIMLVLVLGGVALAYVIDAVGRRDREPAHRMDSGTELTRTLAGKELSIPHSWFRYPEQAADGFARQIDLHLALPLGPRGALRGVEVTLLPRSAVRPSAKLLDGVYLHLFGPTQVEGPTGLVGKPLTAKEGYEGEIVWYDPISPDPFVAKCSAIVSADVPPSCLRTVHLAPGIGAIYTFDADLLANWRNFDAAMRVPLTQMGVL
jgi:hypothetical protein